MPSTTCHPCRLGLFLEVIRQKCVESRELVVKDSLHLVVQCSLLCVVFLFLS